MGLSAASLVQLQAARDALDTYYERRLEEIDRDVRNLRAYGSSMNALGDEATEGATDEAVDILSRLGVEVIS